LDEQETGYQLRIMSEENTKKSSLDLKPAQIAAGALAAVTAAYLGSTLNVAGTIAGAAVASVVSTIGSALYQSSIERTRESVRRVGSKAWVVKPVEGETASEAEAAAAEVATVAETSADAGGEPRGTRRWPKIAVGALLVFVLGMLAVTGLEWVRGAPLSGGDRGTSVGAVVGKPTERQQQQQQSPTPSVSSPPVTPGPSSTTTPPPSTTSSAPPTTTGSSPPSSSAQTSAPPSSTTGRTSAQTPSQPTPIPPPDLGTTG
jgi:hypothetical protein